MSEFKNLDRLDPDVQRRLRAFLPEVVSLCGENLVSVILYGSAAAGQRPLSRRSNINLLFVLRSLEMADLTRLLKPLQRGFARRLVAPLFLTFDHIQRSQDCFPIEFLEIRDRHLVLWGPNVFDGLEIDPVNLRIQAKQQIKSLLIRLRQSYLELGSSRRGLEEILKRSVPALLVVLRTLQRLAGQVPDHDAAALVRSAARLAAFDPETVLALVRDKENDERIGGLRAAEYFDVYLRVLAQIETAVQAS